MLKIENDNSQWNFWDLMTKTVKDLKNLGNGYLIEKNLTIEYERLLIKFIERLPSGDYSNLREEWDKR